MFPLLSFDQANPVMTGMNRMQALQLQAAQARQMQIQNQYLPQGLAESNRGLSIGNDLKDVQLRYAPQMSEAQLRQLAASTGLMGAQTGEANARIPLYGAQADLARQQADLYPYIAAGNLDPVTKLFVGRMLGNKIMGAPGGQGIRFPQHPSQMGNMQPPPQQQPGMNQIPSYLLRPQQQMLPQGQPTPQGGMPMTAQSSPQGGAPQMPQQSQGISPQTQNLMQQLGMNPSQGAGGQGGSIYDQLYGIQMRNAIAQMTKDPTMGSQRSGAGGTYTDPTTSQQYSTDTSRNTSLDQQAIGAIDRVNPLLQILSDKLAPFQTAKGQATLRAGQIGNYLGMENKAPNDYAEGRAALKTAPEALLKAWGLNVTNESLQTMKEAVEPIYGESKKGYEQRIINTMNQLHQNQQQAAERLTNGVQLGSPQGAENYSQEDLAHTAKLHNMTIEQVKQKLGAR